MWICNYICKSGFSTWHNLHICTVQVDYESFVVHFWTTNCYVIQANVSTEFRGVAKWTATESLGEGLKIWPQTKHVKCKSANKMGCNYKLTWCTWWLANVKRCIRIKFLIAKWIMDWCSVKFRHWIDVQLLLKGRLVGFQY